MSLSVQGIDAYYGKSRILNDISLQVDGAEVVALMGRNGVGKTTTLRTIIGIVSPKKGTLRWRNRDITGAKPYQIARLGIGYVPEERNIFPRLSVHENLLMGRRAMKGRTETAPYWDLDRIHGVFPVLKARRDQMGIVLSGGEQQMLTIARTLMGNPGMLLVDEPTEGLSPLMRKNVAEILKEINQHRIAILLVEQNMQVALFLAQRGYLMSKGCIVYSGTTHEIRENEEVRRKYLEV
jgi:branched-chain amino acid transport system ATP-binding protein